MHKHSGLHYGLAVTHSGESALSNALKNRLLSHIQSQMEKTLADPANSIDAKNLFDPMQTPNQENILGVNIYLDSDRVEMLRPQMLNAGYTSEYIDNLIGRTASKVYTIFREAGNLDFVMEF